jgi:predicted amidohydrolase
VPTVAACQVEVDDLAPDANLARLERRVAGLPDRADVAVFPEYALTGFDTGAPVQEAALDRSTVAERLGAVVSEHEVAPLAGYLERVDENLYNAATYVSPDGAATTYRKRNLWGREDERITPDEERVVVDTPLGRTGLLTCYDLNFVEESAQFTRERVDALLVVGAWPAPHGANWRLLCRVRALDEGRLLVGANRTGTSGETPGDGRRVRLRGRRSGANLHASPSQIAKDCFRFAKESCVRHQAL